MKKDVLIGPHLMKRILDKARKRRKRKIKEKMDHDKDVEKALEQLYGKING